MFSNVRNSIQALFPISWRYLLYLYLQPFSIALASFATVLIIVRLREVARLAAMGASLGSLLSFTWYQIVYMLPIAVPVACLIAAWVLFQRLSLHHELVAFRAAGYSLAAIMRPIWIAAIYLSFLNFYIVSEWATHAYATSQQLKENLTTLNPLFLLQNSEKFKWGNWNISVGSMEKGSLAKEVTIVFKHQRNQRLTLISMKELELGANQLLGREVGTISSFAAVPGDDFDHIILENQRQVESSPTEFSKLIEPRRPAIQNNYLPWNLLGVRLQQAFQDRKQLLSKTDPDSTAALKTVQAQIARMGSELLRRLYVALAPLSFTGLGMALGVEIGRQRKRGKWIKMLVLASLFITAFFTAKALEEAFFKILCLYALPHLLILVVVRRELKQIEQGKEA